MTFSRWFPPGDYEFENPSVQQLSGNTKVVQLYTVYCYWDREKKPIGKILLRNRFWSPGGIYKHIAPFLNAIFPDSSISDSFPAVWDYLRPETELLSLIALMASEVR